METSTSNGFWGAIEEMIAAIFGLIWEMLEAFLEVLPKVLSFFLWCLSAIFILPIVWIAGQIYPMWVKWGENF